MKQLRNVAAFFVGQTKISAIKKDKTFEIAQ